MFKLLFWGVGILVGMCPLSLMSQGTEGPHEGRYYLVYEELNFLQWLLNPKNSDQVLQKKGFEEELDYIRGFIEEHIRNKDRYRAPAFLCIDKRQGLAFYKSASGTTRTDHAGKNVDFAEFYSLISDIRNPETRKALEKALVQNGEAVDVVNYVHFSQQGGAGLFDEKGKAELLTSFNKRFDESQKEFDSIAGIASLQKLAEIRTKFTTVRSGEIVAIDLNNRTAVVRAYDGNNIEFNFPEKYYATFKGNKEIDLSEVIHKGNKVDIRMTGLGTTQKGSFPTAVKMDLRYSTQK